MHCIVLASIELMSSSFSFSFFPESGLVGNAEGYLIVGSILGLTLETRGIFKLVQ